MTIPTGRSFLTSRCSDQARGAPDGLLADAVESSDDEDSGGESDAGIRKRAPQSAAYQSNYIGSETAFLTAV
ncbi:hypothetical protein V3C99_011416 [Haemonchus contortus]